MPKVAFRQEGDGLDAAQPGKREHFADGQVVDVSACVKLQFGAPGLESLFYKEDGTAPLRQLNEQRAEASPYCPNAIYIGPEL